MCLCEVETCFTELMQSVCVSRLIITCQEDLEDIEFSIRWEDCTRVMLTCQASRSVNVLGSGILACHYLVISEVVFYVNLLSIERYLTNKFLFYLLLFLLFKIIIVIFIIIIIIITIIVFIISCQKTVNKCLLNKVETYWTDDENSILLWLTTCVCVCVCVCVCPTVCVSVCALSFVVLTTAVKQKREHILTFM